MKNWLSDAIVVSIIAGIVLLLMISLMLVIQARRRCFNRYAKFMSPYSDYRVIYVFYFCFSLVNLKSLLQNIFMKGIRIIHVILEALTQLLCNILCVWNMQKYEVLLQGRLIQKQSAEVFCKKNVFL